jgi:hypothetical protein
LRNASFSLIERLETLLLKRANIHLSDTGCMLDALIPETIRISADNAESGYQKLYAGAELDKIETLQLDVLLMAGAGALGGGIFKAAKFGVVSARHSDDNSTRGGPEGFWEVFFKQDYTGFAVHQLGDGTQAGNDLVSGHITTQYYYSLNRMRIRQKCLHYLKDILSGIARNRQLPPCAASMPSGGRTHGMPGLAVQTRYMASLGYRLINRFFRSKLKKDFKWSVAYQKNDWASLVMENAVRIPNPENHFLADPFVVSEGGGDYCFVEDYDYSTCRGHIAVYQLHEQHAECLGNALIEPFHLSFPYMFRFESELYMCPETSGSGQIRIYKCAGFPLRWELHRVIMENVSAVDTMLFERGGRWWMLTNIDMSGTGDHCSELCVFWADNPLSGDWTALPGNPIFIDTAKGRNAGLLFDGESHYRVAQKQGFERYGKAFSINRIEQLDCLAYKETEVYSVRPLFFPNLIGSHHMHSNGNVSVFDFLEDK